MTIATVHWTAFRRFGSLDGLRDGHLYMIAGARRTDDRRWTHIKPLYIGMAFRSEVADRIRQQHTAYRWVHEQQSLVKSGRELIVSAGDVTTSTQARVTQALVKDVESMLIRGSQPKFNTRDKSSYSGRIPLIVKNTGAVASLFSGPFACCSRHYNAHISRKHLEGDCGA